MKTYSLWLEETAISKQAMEQLNFPPQYNTAKLFEILNGNTAHWTEYIYLPDIRKEQRYQSDQWARKCFRVKSTKHLRTPLPRKQKITAVERIKRHLSSYDKQLESPTYVKPEILQCMSITRTTLKELQNKIKTLNSTATKFHFTTCEVNSLNRNYLDVIVDLYEMVPYNDVTYKSCSNLVFNRRCKQAAKIQTTLEKIRKRAEVDRKIQKNRERHNVIMDETINMNVDEFAQCIEETSTIIRVLLSKQGSKTSCTDLVTNTGIDFFYNVVENLTDITTKFAPTKEFYTQILNELAMFVQENQEKEGLKILELTLKRPDLVEVLGGVFQPGRTSPEYFLKMYQFLMDSYLKRCDMKILFVLLSKFDLLTWLETFRPKLYDISQLLQLILRGLECWSQPDSSVLQSQFQRHLVHVFNYDFPQHYGEVIQMVLDRISDQKLKPTVLFDLLNSLLERFGCVPVTMNTTCDEVEEISIDFARRQNLFNLKAATDTAMLFARHFQKERLHHGLHGLYPKHKDYCTPLSMWFSSIGHVVVISAICTYQELLADQISEVIFGSIIEMYSPWLIIYTEQTMLQLNAANWIKQLKENDKILYPWSEQHANTSKIIIAPFIQTMAFALENLPVSHKILSHIFGWYVHHFTLPNTPSYIYNPIHEGIALLPWERFKPDPIYIDMLYDSLQKYIPESHAMLGHIFIRIDWNAWFTEKLSTLDKLQTQAVSRLFTIFIKIAFEPNIHVHINTSKILEDAIKYPWYMVEYEELENLFKWVLSSVEPSIILKLPSESNYADRAVLDLLRLSCAMMPEMAIYWKATLQPNSNATAKRILYARSTVRLLRLCAAKNNKLLATKDGVLVFNNAFMELLNAMNSAINAIATTKTLEERKREALNLMIEVIVPMQTQSEETSNYHVGTLIQWQQRCGAGNLLMCSVLNAVGHMTAFISSTYTLLEATIDHYFHTSEEASWHTPSWQALLHTLQMSLDKLELMPIIRGPSFFLLHIFILYRIDRMPTTGDKITFLQDLSQLIENLKTKECTEERLAIVWGAIISRGCQILSESELAKKPLLMLARHLHVLSMQSDGWGDGILGVIGLKKDIVTNNRKVLSRCLACVVFSLFPDKSHNEVTPNQEFLNSMQELSMLLANKKFLNAKPLIVKAVGIINEASVPNLTDVPHLVCRLIALFYDSSLLVTIPEIWDFNFKLK